MLDYSIPFNKTAHMKKWFIILLINSYYAYLQQLMTVDKWRDYMEDWIFESEDPLQMEEIYEELSYLMEHPLNLNTVTKEELGRIPFLSDHQIERLINYRETYGNMVTLYELKDI